MNKNSDNLTLRVFSAFILGPLLLFAVFYGGIPFTIVAVITLCLGAWEFGKMYTHIESNQTSLSLLVLMTGAVTLARALLNFQLATHIFASCILLAMAWAVFSYEHGNSSAGNGFAVLITGATYFGWIGAYLISLRQLPQGGWLTCICIVIVWMSDTGAFFFGKALGKHTMTKRVSPKKSWEGYFGGIITALLICYAAYRFIHPIQEIMQVSQMLFLALLISAIAPLGDFGESMIKRTFGSKDSSHLIPGHGGVFDRLDTVLWAMPIGYIFCSLI